MEIEHNKWVGTWIFGAFQWAQVHGTEQHRKNCLALLQRVMPELFIQQSAAPAETWQKFITHLNSVQPLGKPDKEGKTLPHQSFIGSISSYRKVFLDANQDIK